MTCFIFHRRRQSGQSRSFTVYYQPHECRPDQPEELPRLGPSKRGHSRRLHGSPGLPGEGLEIGQRAEHLLVRLWVQGASLDRAVQPGSASRSRCSTATCPVPCRSPGTSSTKSPGTTIPSSPAADRSLPGGHLPLACSTRKPWMRPGCAPTACAPGVTNMRPVNRSDWAKRGMPSLAASQDSQTFIWAGYGGWTSWACWRPKIPRWWCGRR